MPFLADCGRALTGYFSSTWTASAFVVGAELTLAFHFFTDPHVFGALPPLVLKWHTVFAFPVVFFATLPALLHRFCFEKWSANPIVAIASAIVCASFRQAPLVAALLGAAALCTAVAEQRATAPRVAGSAAAGAAAYRIITAAPAVGAPAALGACALATALAVASGHHAGDNFHAALVRNLAFVAFDAVYRWGGATPLGVYGAIGAEFALLYAGCLMAEYGWAFTRARKSD